MMLSLCSSSLSVSAVDTTSMVHTEGTGQVSTLFEDELNEKLADLSSDFGITSVEVNNNKAVVKYHATRDCTVLIGIYKDDGTKGTHMLSFEKGELKATEVETTITLNNLPNYFYLKAYLIDSETYKPLAKVYDCPNYTLQMKKFFERTVNDFPEDRVWNLDDSDTTNFMVLADGVKVVNMNNEIDLNNISITSNSVSVSSGAEADTTLLDLKKGDPFMFFTKDGVVHGIVTSVSINDGKALVNFSEATMDDMFEHIRIEIDSNAGAPEDLPVAKNDTEKFASSIDSYSINNSFNDNYQTFSASRSLSGTASAADKLKINREFGTEDLFKFSTGFGASSDDDATIQIEGNVNTTLALKAPGSLKIYHSAYDEDEITYAEIAITPMLNVKVSGEGSIAIKHNFLGKDGISVPIAGNSVVNIVALNFNISGELKFTVSGDMNLDIPIMGEVSLSADFKSDDMINVNKTAKNMKLNAAVEATISIEVLFKVSVRVLEVKNLFTLLEMGIETGIESETKFKLYDDSLQTNRPDTIHYCSSGECFEIEMELSLVYNIFISCPILKLIDEDHINLSLETERVEFDASEGELKIELIKIELIGEKRGNNKFYFRKSDFHIYAGECPEKGYQVDFDVIDIAYQNEKDLDKVPHIFGAEIKYKDSTGHVEKTITDQKGIGTLYLKADEQAVITITYDGYLDHEFTIEKVEEPGKYTIALTPLANVKNIYIESLPDKTTYKIDEQLDITGLTIKAMFDNGKSEIIKVTPDMISGFDSSKNGDVTVKVTYTDYYGGTAEVSFNVKINSGHVDRIEMGALPAKRTYYVGEDNIDLQNAYINIYYKDGTESEKSRISKDMVSGFDTSTVGEKIITVTYTDSYGDTAETSFKIEVYKYPIERIEMASPPNILDYGVGNKNFSLDGASIRIIYSDGREPTIEPVTISMTSGFDTSTLGEKVITVTYSNPFGTEYTTTFKIYVVKTGISSISILQLLDENKYCQINGELNYKDALLQVIYDGGKSEILKITKEMTGDFDSSRLGIFPVVVSYGGHSVQYNVEVVENLKKVCRIEIYDSNKVQMLYADDYIDDPYGGNSSYTVYEYYADGTYNSYFSGFASSSFDGNKDIIINDDFGGSIKILNFDHTELGVHELIAIYHNPDGTFSESVATDSIWYSVHEGKGGFNRDETASAGDKIEFKCSRVDGEAIKRAAYTIGQYIYAGDYYFDYYVYEPDSETESGLKRTWKNPYDDNHKIKSEFLLSSANYLGGFDTSYPLRNDLLRKAYFEYDGYVFTASYAVEKISVEEDIASVSYSVPMSVYSNSNMFTETSYLQPIPTMTNNSESISVLSTLKTAAFTDLLTDEIYNYYVVKNASAADIFSKDNLLFIGQAVSDGRGNLSVEYETTTGEDGDIILKPMSYINLSNAEIDIDNPVYNGKEQVVIPVIKINGKLLEKDIDYTLGGDTTARDVGKYTIVINGIGDYTGSVQVSYEIKKSSSDDTTNPPVNSDNNNTYVPSVPSNIPSVKTWNVPVENLITGKTTSATAKLNGSDITVNLGVKNNGYYANLYSETDELIDVVLIKKGSIKIVGSEDDNFRIVIDTEPHYEYDDVSSDAGIFTEEQSVDFSSEVPYAAIIVIIAVTGAFVMELKKRRNK